MVKNIVVSDETYDALCKIRDDGRLKSLDVVIDELLKAEGLK